MTRYNVNPLMRSGRSADWMEGGWADGAKQAPPVAPSHLHELGVGSYAQNEQWIDWEQLPIATFCCWLFLRGGEGRGSADAPTSANMAG